METHISNKTQIPPLPKVPPGEDSVHEPVRHTFKGMFKRAEKSPAYWKELHALSEERAKELEDRLFALGAMNEAPCFCCGYNGPGYFQPDQHPCAARHHDLSNA